MNITPSDPPYGAYITAGGGAGEFSISVAAQKAEVHEQTLRHYERLGLITPARKGPGKHSPRLYSDHDIERVIYIRQLMHDLGVNLAGVEAIMRMRDQIDALHLQIASERQRERLVHEAEIRRLKQIITRLQGGLSDQA